MRTLRSHALELWYGTLAIAGTLLAAIGSCG